MPFSNPNRDALNYASPVPPSSTDRRLQRPNVSPPPPFANGAGGSRAQTLPPPSRVESGDTVRAIGQFVAAGLLLALSPMALMVLGWQYADTGGSPIEKFHPSTLLIGALVAWIALRYGNPLAGLLDLAQTHARLLPYFAASVVMVLYSAFALRLPITIFIETFIGAGLTLIVFSRGGESSKVALAWLIHAVLMANAGLAFYEQAAGWKLTPLVVNNEILTDEPRSTALLGHPLANAMLMSCYVVMLALGGGRDLPAVLRPVVFLVALASLVPFGGRAATAVCLLALAWIVIGRIAAVLRGGTFDTRALVAALIVAPMSAVGLMLAYDAGALDTLANRVVDDTGSAATRVEMFELFRYLSFDDLLFAPKPEQLMTWVVMHGLEYGIESFLVAFVLNYGLLCTLIFMPAFALFFLELAAVTGRGAWLPIAVFLAVAVTSLSLSTKTPALSLFVVMMCVLMRVRPEDERVA